MLFFVLIYLQSKSVLNFRTDNSFKVQPYNKTFIIIIIIRVFFQITYYLKDYAQF